MVDRPDIWENAPRSPCRRGQGHIPWGFGVGRGRMMVYPGTVERALLHYLVDRLNPTDVSSVLAVLLERAGTLPAGPQRRCPWQLPLEALGPEVNQN